MSKVIRKQARNRGIVLSRVTGGKRKYKTTEELLKSIIKHDTDIINKRANKTKNMLTTCKSIMAVINNNSTARVMYKPPPPPPPPPKLILKGPPPPPPPPPKKNKMSVLNELKAFQAKKGLKNKYNKNAKQTIA